MLGRWEFSLPAVFPVFFGAEFWQEKKSPVNRVRKRKFRKRGVIFLGE
jgi:hypothetical protein